VKTTKVQFVLRLNLPILLQPWNKNAVLLLLLLLLLSQVKQLLADAKDLDALITNLPSLLEPRTLISVLVTVRKW
jgi:hypothetical protein